MIMDASHLNDDALSASLDGALDGAGDQDHLAGCAACRARRDQLDAARAALAAAPVEPVDELTRRRLVAAALDAAGPAVVRNRPWYQSPALAGGVAAAILALFAAVPFVTGGNDLDRGEQATASLEAAAGDLFLGDLGDLSDPSVLRDRFGSERSVALSDRRDGEEADDAATGAATSEAPKAATTPAAPPSPMVGGGDVANNPAESAPGAGGADGLYSDESSPLARDNTAVGIDRTVADACAGTLAEGPARGSTLVALATGTYQGTPAVVAVFGGEQGNTAFVVARDGCTILTQYQI